jgi:hypothetical protein
VGLARKTVWMRLSDAFDLLGNPGGIILNIDADCTVKSNYFEAVFTEMGRQN